MTKNVMFASMYVHFHALLRGEAPSRLQVLIRLQKSPAGADGHVARSTGIIPQVVCLPSIQHVICSSIL